MLSAFRIIKRRFVKSAFSGEGARVNGGRWNSIGTPMVYLAESRALAAMEMLVHFDSAELVLNYVLIEVEFSLSLFKPLRQHDLPSTWRRTPGPAALQRIGDEWAWGAKSLLLRVPSAIIADEFNYLLNPRHADFGKLRIAPAVPFRFDRRLLG